MESLASILCQSQRPNLNSDDVMVTSRIRGMMSDLHKLQSGRVYAEKQRKSYIIIQYEVRKTYNRIQNWQKLEKKTHSQKMLKKCQNYQIRKIAQQ